MGRQASDRKRAARVQQAEAELRADLERLRAVTDDCYGSDCPCHVREWAEISAIRAVLGEDPTV